MRVVIVGAGIGGLYCAIACRRQGLDVVVLERAEALAPIGAGIQIPPNAARVASQLGILSQLREKAIVLESIEYLRYANGKLLYKIDGTSQVIRDYGHEWMVISRPDYHETLWKAAQASGAELRLGCEASRIDFYSASVELTGGEIVTGDIIVGADGLWSRSRDQLLGRASPPAETGDLAYRVTLSRAHLEALQDPKINLLIERKSALCWMGPGKHCVFYPIDGGRQFNLVLLGPDNLDKHVRQAPGDLAEMRASFDGWDERLTKMLSCVSEVLKWKLCHHEELETWVRGRIALLGDACHPTLPYQAQGAAMAAEDGVVLGNLLGQLAKSKLYHSSARHKSISEVLMVYERLRKSRTTVNVRGAKSNQYAYHIPDGPLQEARDSTLLSALEQEASGTGKGAGISLSDREYLHVMLAFDSVEDSTEAFRQWQADKTIIAAKV